MGVEAHSEHTRVHAYLYTDSHRRTHVHVHAYIHTYIHVLMRDERRKKERSKQRQTNKQGKATQHTQGSLLLEKMRLRWDVHVYTVARFVHPTLTPSSPHIQLCRVLCGAHEYIWWSVPQSDHFVRVGASGNRLGPSQTKICQLELANFTDEQVLGL